MSAGEILLAGKTIFFRRRRKLVPYQPIQPLGQGIVKGRLQVSAWGLRPCLQAHAGEPLGGYKRFAVDMRGARSFFDVKAFPVPNAVRSRDGPELGLRKSRTAKCLKRVNRRAVRAA